MDKVYGDITNITQACTTGDITNITQACTTAQEKYWQQINRKCDITGFN